MTVTAEYAIELGRQVDELEAENEQLRAELKKVQEAWYGRCVVIDERDAEIGRLRQLLKDIMEDTSGGQESMPHDIRMRLYKELGKI